ncbi:hypothetical protein BHF71_06610 [Vulcanibacillus modesticaldus]|uniref:GAF domain-containing protein n=1 Tax=Vulcanibacillus modesticaldus TaxID=337097 RepID=A0A1D2YWJ5_9BACI|nr:GAF domain-containing protein [Vulcanibacillus modesticaldus]OEG00028.1 hypothetical protein BHF71_06610 [Vulcanibacillus modesticaldus]
MNFYNLQTLSIGVIFIVTVLIALYLGILYGKKTQKKIIIDGNDTSNYLNETEMEENKNIRHSIVKKMTTLQEEIDADFLGLAIYDAMTEEIRWRLAVGATNSRYKRIVIRLGKGIAGEVIQLNRTIKIEDFPHDVLGDPIEYPILLVEYLKSVIAVPVADQQRIYGVLLVGQRNKRIFTDIEEQRALLKAKEIAKELELANIFKRVTHDSTEITNVNIYDCIFVQYLMRRQHEINNEKRGELQFEILDQAIVEIPWKVQKKLIKNLEEILNIVSQRETDRVNISIVRDENYLVVECISNRMIPSTKMVFENIYNRLGEIGGSIISYYEKDQLHFLMQIPLSLKTLSVLSD